GAVTSGDMLMAFSAGPSDSVTWGSQNFSGTGLTVGARTEIAEMASSTGNDIGGASWYAQVTAGTLSGTTITATATLSSGTNAYGPVVVVRVRDAVPFPIHVIDVVSGGTTTNTNVSMPLPSGANFFIATAMSITTAGPPSGWTELVNVDGD